MFSLSAWSLLWVAVGYLACDGVEGLLCCSDPGNQCYSCSSTEICCSSLQNPCCAHSTSYSASSSISSNATGLIIGSVIGCIVVIVIIAIIVFLLYRASKRKRTGVVLTQTRPTPSIQSTHYYYGQNQGGQPWAGPGMVYPPTPRVQGTDPAYPPPSPTYHYSQNIK